MLRVVLDTNVQIGALISRGGTCDQVLRKWLDGAFILCSCEEILSELYRVIKYPDIAKRHKLSEDKISRYINYQEKNSFKVFLPEIINLVKAHPSDSIFILCALEASADYIVSGDNHLLNLQTYKSIKIITPIEFLKKL